MPRSRNSLSVGEARRVALAAQGFDRQRPDAPSDVRHFRRALGAVGVLQLDFVNVLIPAHFLVMWSRLGPYDRERFERFLYRSREFTAQWAHEASLVRAGDWPLLAHRPREFQPPRNNPINDFRDKENYLADVLRQVRQEGAVTSNDLPALAGPKRKPGDWHRSMPRRALEYHFARGKLAIARRMPNFQRVYDLPERLLDRQHRDTRVGKKGAMRELLRQAAVSLGIATLQDLADFYRMSARDAAPRVRELVEQGELSEVTVEDWADTAYLSRSARSPRQIRGASLLSPFDPVVWFRPRAERLFDFRYRIEIYVPKPERKWGYYVLPFRVGDCLVARVDLKADRHRSVLRVQSAHPEVGIDEQAVAMALARELQLLAEWLQLDRTGVVSRNRFSRLIAEALGAY